MQALCKRPGAYDTMDIGKQKNDHAKSKRKVLYMAEVPAIFRT
jgi:hypothetical protein